jgi:hypothetical protein
VGRKVIDVLGRDICVIPIFEQSPTIVLTKNLTETVFIDGTGSIVVEEAGLDVLLEK